MTLFSHKVKQLLRDVEALDPPPACRTCGSQDYSIILTGATRTPGDDLPESPETA